MILSLQTWAAGRPTPLRTLKQFLNASWPITTFNSRSCSDIAGWCEPPNSATKN